MKNRKLCFEKNFKIFGKTMQKIQKFPKIQLKKKILKKKYNKNNIFF